MIKISQFKFSDTELFILNDNNPKNVDENGCFLHGVLAIIGIIDMQKTTNKKKDKIQRNASPSFLNY